MIYMFLSNNPSSGDINSSNLPCYVCFMSVCVVLSGLFLVVLWSPAGKRLTPWQLCFVTFPNVSLSTSELRVMLAPRNWFKPSSKIF